MRLTSREAEAIRRAAHETFGEEAVVRLFGSRLDDSRRGGDIDLLVNLPTQPTHEARAAFRRRLDRDVGEREYDILLLVGAREPSAVERKALSEGVVL